MDVYISKIKAVKSMKDITKIMDSLGVSDEGLETIDEMKDKVIDKIKKSQEEAKWSPGQAFSEFAAARDQDISKRKELHKIYEKAEGIVNKCEEKLLKILDCYFGCKLQSEIPKRKGQLLKKEYVLLFAGETSSGKSSLINLILGEDFLPHAKMAVTSTICEVRYGHSRKIKIHYKDVKKEPEEMYLSDPNEGESYIDQLKPYLRQEKNRKEGSPFKKIELFCPHELLKDGIVIVDSPGIGEYEEMDKMVAEYLDKAFFFIYVINSDNAGGVSEDRLIGLLRKVKAKAGESLISEGAIFVCNKWDRIQGDPEEEKLENEIIGKLKSCWPDLDLQTQVVKLSTTAAIESQKYGVILPQFKMLIHSVRSMLMRAIISRLEKECRWLDSVLSRTHFHTTILMRNEQHDNPMERLLMLKLKLEFVKLEYVSCIEKLQNKLEHKTKEAVKHLIIHLKKPSIVEKFTTWSGDECQEDELTAAAEEEVEEIIKEKFQREIDKWEAENHIITHAYDSLMKRLKKYSDRLEFQIKAVEEAMANDSKPDDDDILSTATKVTIGLTSPIWFPVALVGGILSLPVLGVMAAQRGIRRLKAKKLYKDDRKTYLSARSEEFLKEHMNEDVLRPFITPKFEAVRLNVEEMKSNFAKLIEADMLLILQVLGESTFLCNAAEIYAPINAECVNVRGELSIFTIKEIIPKDINISDLQWAKDRIGSGTFADVFKGSLETAKGKRLDVAVKVCKDMLTEKNALDVLSEEILLRSIDHENVVKFYGAVLQEESGGTKFIFVMELCAENLRMYLEKHKDRVPGKAPDNLRKKAVSQTLKWARDVACGLEYLHGKQIVHRDLKPDNILVGIDGKSLKIADVGIAIDEKNVTGTVVGTPLYMAPEIFSESEIYDSSVDIYSFGLILWELWYGQIVFLESLHNQRKLMAKIVEGFRPQHVNGCYHVISRLDTLMQKCWKANPKDRINSKECATELKCTLEWWEK